MTNEKVLEIVKKLLALGTSPNQNEANAAIAKANELMLRHNLSMGDVESLNLADYGEKDVNYDFTIETKYIQDLLKRYFFVEIFLTPGLKKWTVCGTKENVEIALYMFSYIKNQFSSAWLTYKKLNEIEGIKGKTDFYYGAWQGLRTKLEDERSRLKQEEGLIWLGDPKLKEYMDENHGRLRKASGSNHRMSGDARAKESGYEAGKSMNLSKGISHGATKQKLIG